MCVDALGVVLKHRIGSVSHDFTDTQYLVAWHIFGKFSHIAVNRIGDDFLRCSGLYYDSIFHNRDTIPHFDRFKKVVSDEHHRLLNFGLDIE